MQFVFFFICFCIPNVEAKSNQGKLSEVAFIISLRSIDILNKLDFFPTQSNAMRHKGLTTL